MVGWYVLTSPRSMIDNANVLSSQTLLCPVMFNSIGEKTLYIFGISNIISIPIVWALYPESNQRTLEDMDLLFAADTPWNWDAERTFAQLKAGNPDLGQGTGRSHSVVDPETGKPLRSNAPALTLDLDTEATKADEKVAVDHVNSV